MVFNSRKSEQECEGNARAQARYPSRQAKALAISHQPTSFLVSLLLACSEQLAQESPGRNNQGPMDAKAVRRLIDKAHHQLKGMSRLGLCLKVGKRRTGSCHDESVVQAGQQSIVK